MGGRCWRECSRSSSVRTRLRWLSLVSRQRITSFVAKEDTATLDELRGLSRRAASARSSDSEYSLEQAADAVALVRHGRPAGKVLVSVAA